MANEYGVDQFGKPTGYDQEASAPREENKTIAGQRPPAPSCPTGSKAKWNEQSGEWECTQEQAPQSQPQQVSGQVQPGAQTNVAQQAAQQPSTPPPQEQTPAVPPQAPAWAPSKDNVPEGYDLNKWMNPDKKTDKYVAGRVYAQTGGDLDAVVQALGQGWERVPGSKDAVREKATGATFDMTRDIGGANAQQWTDVTQNPNAPAPARSDAPSGVPGGGENYSSQLMGFLNGASPGPMTNNVAAIPGDLNYTNASPEKLGGAPAPYAPGTAPGGYTVDPYTGQPEVQDATKKLIMNLLGTKTMDISPQLKEAQKENTLDMSNQLRQQALASGARMGRAGSGLTAATLGDIQQGAMGDISKSYRDIDVKKAQQDRTDMENAVGISGQYQKGLLDEYLGKTDMGLKGNQQGFQQFMDTEKLKMGAQAQGFQQWLGQQGLLLDWASLDESSKQNLRNYYLNMASFLGS